MNNQAILITGASSGIGQATARLLAQRGFHVYAGVRSEADAQGLRAESLEIEPIILDVTISEQIAAAAERIANAHAPLRGVVCNAGVAVAGPLEYLPIEALRQQFEINVFGQIALAQAMLPCLRETCGRLIFIGSIAGRISAPLIGPYSASKAALSFLVDALRQELHGSGVTLSLFEFAAVKTPIWAKGRAAKDILIERLPPIALERYGSLVEKLVAQTKHEERVGIDPAVIAQAIHAALLASRPREHYLIGTQARVQAIIASLPVRLRDAVIRKVMGR